MSPHNHAVNRLVPTLDPVAARKRGGAHIVGEHKQSELGDADLCSANLVEMHIEERLQIGIPHVSAQSVTGARTVVDRGRVESVPSGLVAHQDARKRSALL